ncbi:MAG: FAD-binding oxidoreductase [Nitrospirota bacterium]
MSSHGQTWDFAVIGGGIGGLAVAELLQRSGASVILLEKNSVLCGGASAEQQGWFHTGALYTALPLTSYFRTMVGNLDDLVDYYSGFPKMNLKVDKHLSTTDHDGWFSNRTNFYVYTSCRGVSWAWKLPWAVALRRAKRRMDWFESLDVSRSLSRQMGPGAKPTRFVIHNTTLGVNLDNVAFTLKSRDRAMNTELIARDLLNSFLSNGGLVKTQTAVTNIERGCVTASHPNGEGRSRYRARHIILATGKDSVNFDQRTRVFISPLLVAYPALTDMNFVKMSPHMKDTINHIYHRFDGLDYSLIGNAVYYAPDHAQGVALNGVRSAMLSTAGRVFGDLGQRETDLYFGYKTEVTSSSSLRNYLYHIVDRGAFTLVLPGKFSLCFSLAVNVCRHFGLEPVERVRMKEDDAVGQLIEEPLHQRIAKRLRTRASA